MIVLKNDCISIKFGPTSQGLDIEKSSNGVLPSWRLLSHDVLSEQ
jgi:hypothetical protein